MTQNKQCIKAKKYKIDVFISSKKINMAAGDVGIML
jgi:hypothetical protein